MTMIPETIRNIVLFRISLSKVSTKIPKITNTTQNPAIKLSEVRMIVMRCLLGFCVICSNETPLI